MICRSKEVVLLTDVAVALPIASSNVHRTTSRSDIGKERAEMTHDPLESVKARLALAEQAQLSEFECEGRTFVVLPEVFPPTHFSSTGIFARSIDYVPGRSFFELGCGTGVIAVTAALAGCRPVVASDISESAVRNARLNLARHGLEHSTSVRQGDLFDVLDDEERFDTIFWNSNFVHVPDDYAFTQDYLRAFCDPGYRTHARFLREAPRHLAPGGRLLLGFSSQGDDSALQALFAEHGYRSTTLVSTHGVGPNAHRYDVVRLQPPARAVDNKEPIPIGI
jgi:release factor glutamine methyltransferase